MYIIGLDVGVLEGYMMGNPSEYIDVRVTINWCIFMVKPAKASKPSKLDFFNHIPYILFGGVLWLDAV